MKYDNKILITKEQLKNFVQNWLDLKCSSVLNKDDFKLENIIEKCFDNSDCRMFNSWFNNYDVMN